MEWTSLTGSDIAVLKSTQSKPGCLWAMQMRRKNPIMCEQKSIPSGQPQRLDGDGI